MELEPTYNQVNPHMQYAVDPGNTASPLESINKPDVRTRLLRMFRWSALILLWVVMITFWLAKIFPKNMSSEYAAVFSILAFLFASVFLFYALYHLTALALAVTRARPKFTFSRQLWPEVPVALLLTVCDDFKVSAAETLLVQNYSHFSVYICDDSRDRQTIEAVNAFHDKNKGKTTIIRRENNKGFKAGNINHALRTGVITEPLILLLDADEELESTFLRSIVEEFVTSDASFVQASHQAAGGNAGTLQRALSPSVSTYWIVYEQARNAEGFPLVLGHGVLLPRILIEELGGFDEMTTSEDIEFSYRIGLSSKFGRGRVSCRAWAGEEVPRSTQHYRVRFCRWLQQDLALGLRMLRNIFLRSGGLSAAERIDLFVKQFHIPMCGLAFPYLIMLSVFLVISNVSSGHVQASMTSTQKCVFLGLGFVLTLAPVFPVLLLGQGRFLKKVWCAGTSIWLFNSLIVDSGLALAGLLVRSFEVKFVATGSQIRGQRDNRSLKKLLPYLTLILLAAAASCAILGSMVLAALGAIQQEPKFRWALNSIAASLLVIGLWQLSTHPVYILALLPLGCFRY